MNPILNKLLVFLLLAACLLQGPVASAGVKPEWMRKSEEQLNQKRTNDSYVFKVFHQSAPDHEWLMDERFEPLLDYVRTRYQARPGTMALDSLVAADMPVTYRVTFVDAEGEGVVLAQRVDSYEIMEDVCDEFHFDLYELFAVSEKNQDVLFDRFSMAEPSRALAALMSVVPGMGQIYKGSTWKGVALFGAEGALVTTAIILNNRTQFYQQKADAGEFPVDSWQSKADAYKTMRNISIGLVAGVWVAGILDALFVSGSQRVIVKDPGGRQLSIEPASTTAGLGLVYSF